MKKAMFSQEALKLLACAAMLVDHIGAYLLPEVTALRIFGRLAFPLYCFLLSEGLFYTRSPGKYLLRAVVCLVLAELPCDLLRCGRFSWQHQSVMVTLTLGLLMGMVMGRMPRLAKPLAVVPFALLATLLQADYGAMGICIIAMFLLTRSHPRERLLQGVGLLLIHLIFRANTVQFAALAAILPICLYSGEKRTASPAVQWGFYLFYPAHLLILWGITRLLGLGMG